MQTASTEVQNPSKSCSVNIVTAISGNTQQKTIDTKTVGNVELLMKSLNLADMLLAGTESLTGHLLIRNEYYLGIVLLQNIEAFPSLYLSGSKLGRILARRTTEDVSLNLLLLTYDFSNVIQVFSLC